MDMLIIVVKAVRENEPVSRERLIELLAQSGVTPEQVDQGVSLAVQYGVIKTNMDGYLEVK